MKAQLWWIANEKGDVFADDAGGTLFTSESLAQKAFDRWNPDCGVSVRPCNLDDDLAQMCNLYHESK